MPVHGLDLIVTRTNLSDATIVPATFADDLPEGACLLRIDQFALTANNITYGVAADMLGYWDFFPTRDARHGRIPVWGFGDVIASAHPGVAVGARVYGYVPMSTHLLVYPGKINEHGFMDVVPHRSERAPIYNQYAYTEADPLWTPDGEAMISLFRPLFTTSFLLEDLHRENAYFGAEQIILTSASSKTSIGLAHLLSANAPDGVLVVGLTSARNRAFVEGLGCYDRVVEYDAVGDLPVVASAFVDMAGNADVRRAVHTHLGDALASSRAVGMTHWQASGGLGGDMPGPKTEFFFAPSYAQQRLADLGRSAFQARLADAWNGFIPAARDWINVVEASGEAAVLAAYHAMLDGSSAPRDGHILSLG